MPTCFEVGSATVPSDNSVSPGVSLFVHPPSSSQNARLWMPSSLDMNTTEATRVAIDPSAILNTSPMRVAKCVP